MKIVVMKKLALFILTSFIISCQGPTEQDFTLGFEKQSKGTSLSGGWFKRGNHRVIIDTLSYSGEKSCKITSTDYGNFGGIVYEIPARFSGKTIELEGYMKTKNVEEGFAGLLISVVDNNQTLASSRMKDQNITGTNDWQKYSIKLDYPEGVENIFIGGVLKGKGKAWFDDFELSIDGENIQTIKESDKPENKASLDK